MVILAFFAGLIACMLFEALILTFTRKNNMTLITMILISAVFYILYRLIFHFSKAINIAVLLGVVVHSIIDISYGYTIYRKYIQNAQSSNLPSHSGRYDYYSFTPFTSNTSFSPSANTVNNIPSEDYFKLTGLFSILEKEWVSFCQTYDKFFSQHLGEVYNYDIALEKLAMHQYQIKMFFSEKSTLLASNTFISLKGRELLAKMDEYANSFDFSVDLLREILNQLKVRSYGDFETYSYKEYATTASLLHKAKRDCTRLEKHIKSQLNL